MCQAEANPRCSFCHRDLYIFTWNNVRTACCNNEDCPLFKQPQNIKEGEGYGQERERKKDSSEKV